MKTIFRVAFLIGVVLLLFWLLLPSPEKIIRHRLDEVARTASFGPDESPLLVAGKAQKLAGFVSPNVEVTLEGPAQMGRTFSGRDELMQAAAGAHAATRSLTVQFLDVNVTVNADQQSATASLTLKARAGGENDSIVQRLNVTFQKTGGEWLITRVETVRPLS